MFIKIRVLTVRVNRLFVVLVDFSTALVSKFLCKLRLRGHTEVEFDLNADSGLSDAMMRGIEGHQYNFGVK